MEKSKKAKKSKAKKQNNKMYLFIIFFVVLIVLILGIILYFNYREKNSNNIVDKYYYTGNRYSVNYAANLLDSIDNNKNIVISPFNINTNLAFIYNGVDNKSYKEIKNYFNYDIKDVNKEMTNKLEDIRENEERTEFNELYESLISTLEETGYNNYSVSTIASLNDNGKKEMQLLLKKIALTYDRIKGKNTLSKKVIEEYTLSNKEVVTNEYSLKLLLDEVLDNYAEYLVKNKVINYTEMLVKKIDIKKINKKFIKDTEVYNINISSNVFETDNELVNNVNTKMKQVTEDNVKRIGSLDKISQDVVILNTLYFDYAWEVPFNSSHVRSQTFYNENGSVSEAQMMYSEENVYLENEHATGFIKDFKGGKYSFVVVVPKNNGEFNLSDLNIDGLIKSRKKKKILVGLPKFQYQSEIDLKKINELMGVKEIYTDKANLTKITDEKMYINENLARVGITIGEKGTRESKVNKDNIEPFTYDEEVDQIIVNKAFAFVIINNESNDIMLLGKVVEM